MKPISHFPPPVLAPIKHFKHKTKIQVEKPPVSVSIQEVHQGRSVRHPALAKRKANP